MNYAKARAEMITYQLIHRGITDPRVLKAMGQVPREKFVPVEFRPQAYDDGVLPIGEDQTISQPYMVAKMVELLEYGKEKVLEIGSGSGYQAAVLAECAAQVYTMERLDSLAKLAQKNLKAAGYSEKVEALSGDGTLGYPAAAPYDGIIVAAGAPAVPQSLKDQLVEGGRLVIPVGDHFLQRLVIVRKKDGNFFEDYRDACVFVPLIGAEGWS